MVIGSCLYLWKHKSRAKTALDDFHRAEKNVARKILGMPLLYPCSTRLKRAFKRLLVKAWEPFAPIFAMDNMVGRICRVLAIFVAGQMLGMIFFFVLALKFATSFNEIGIGVGIGTQVVTLAMLLSPTVRCVALLALPNMLSGRMRTVLIMLALIWVLQGPAMNITRNSASIVEAIACVQDQVVKDMEEVKQYARNVLWESFEPLKSALGAMRGLMNKIKMVLRQAHRVLLKMEALIDKVIAWLGTINFNCGQAMSTPYLRCKEKLRKTGEECRNYFNTSFFKFMSGLCVFTDWVSALCEVARLLFRVCQFPRYLIDKLKKHVFQRAKEGIKNAIKRIEEEIYYDVDFDRKFVQGIELKHNLTVLYEKLKVKTDLYRKVIQVFLDIFAIVLIIYACVYPFVNAIYYHRSYRKRSNPLKDNYMITTQLKQLESKRYELGKETVFPLLKNERRLYIKPTSIKYAKIEWKKLIKKIVMVTCALIVPVTYIVVDLIVYEFVQSVYEYFGTGKLSPDIPDFYTLTITGAGLLARMYNQFIQALMPTKDEATKSTERWSKCFRPPAEPDYDLIYVIGVIIIAVYIMSFIEVYVRRLRRLVCSHFYPEREQVRAFALYKHILHSRGRLFQVLFKMLTSGQSADVGTFLGSRYPIVGRLLHIFGSETQTCIICAQSGSKADTMNFRMCSSETCLTVYCMGCYAVRRKCVNCHLPFKEEKEVVHEKDSSAEDTEEE